MKSQTSLAARNCRLQEWSKMVHSCNKRAIGMSVDEWCRENSITTANYYYRMTQVRKACLDSLSDEAVNQEVAPVPMNLVAPAEEPWNHPVPVLGKNSEGRAIRQVELLLNKLLTTAFETFSVNSVQEVQ